MTIKEAREQAGMTQQQISDLLGIPKRTIENWEGGQRKPPAWTEKMLMDKLEEMKTDIVIRRKINSTFGEPVYNCGRGWRASLLGAMEEAGCPIEMQTLSAFLRSVAIMRGLDEYDAEKIAQQVEEFFGVLEVPKDLNPEHTKK